MRIKKSELEKLIENFLLEDESKAKEKYAIYFAARSFVGGAAAEALPEEYDAGHAWVMVKEPGKGITTYSGKSGAAFETANLRSAFEVLFSAYGGTQKKFNNLMGYVLGTDQKTSNANIDSAIDKGIDLATKGLSYLGFDSDSEYNEEGKRYETIVKRLTQGRNKKQDELLEKYADLKKQGLITKDEYIKLLKNSNWGELKKYKNWESDTFAVANSQGNYVIEVMPRNGESQLEVKKAIEKIASAFENYKEDVTYDPMPGTNKDVPPDARNSNSFAYTLLRHALGSHAEVEKRVNIQQVGMQLPGWGKFVPGLRP